MLPPGPPSCTDQVTAEDCPEASPVTVAVKLTVPPTLMVAGFGDTETVTTGVAFTCTTAAAFRVGSATLVATTWKVPLDAGAV